MSVIPDVPRQARRLERSPISETPLGARYLFDLRPRTFTVQTTERLSGTMVRIRFTSDDNFEGFSHISPSDHLKLFFDINADGSPALPDLSTGRWSPQGRTFRDYTIRWFDDGSRGTADAPFSDIDFVLHDHGVAGRWASTACPGDKLGALGPRGSALVKDPFPWYVLAADETALPTLAHWKVDGYWRRGTVNHDHHSEDCPRSHGGYVGNHRHWPEIFTARRSEVAPP